MASDRRDREERRERRRAGSSIRDARHRSGGDWTTISIPEGISVFQPKDTSYRFDIVPYEVKTGMETLEGNRYARAGEWYYERTYYVHTGVGPNRESYTCPAKTAGKKCPICEFRARMAKDPDGDEKLVRALRPRERQLFLIHLHRQDEDDDEIQLYETSHATFGRLLDDCRQDAEDDETYIRDFDDPDAGALLKASYREEDAGTFKYIECYKIEFRARPNGLDPKLLEHGIDLDAVVKVLPYDELKKAFEQEVEDQGNGEEETRGCKPQALKTNDDDSDESPGRKGKPGSNKVEEPEKPRQPEKAQDEKSPPKRKGVTAQEAGLEEGEKVQTRKFGVCEIVRISRDGTSLTVEDEDGEIHTTVGVDEVRKLKEEKQAPKVDKDQSSELESKKQDDWDEPAPKKTEPASKKPPVDNGWD